MIWGRSSLLHPLHWDITYVNARRTQGGHSHTKYLTSPQKGLELLAEGKCPSFWASQLFLHQAGPYPLQDSTTWCTTCVSRCPGMGASLIICLFRGLRLESFPARCRPSAQNLRREGTLLVGPPLPADRGFHSRETLGLRPSDMRTLPTRPAVGYTRGTLILWPLPHQGHHCFRQSQGKHPF